MGSVGTRAWILLLLGPDSQDPLFLQAKEAQSSVLEPFTGAGPFKQQGRRVVEGQRLMQAASDIFLGWTTAKGVDGKQRDFYVRQLWDGKGSAEIERMNSTTMGLYAKLCGWTLARAHARSATASRSPRTSARARPSTEPSATSPRPTLIRTIRTSRSSRRRSPRSGSTQSPAFDLGHTSL